MSEKLDPSVLLILGLMGVDPTVATDQEIEQARQKVTQISGADAEEAKARAKARADAAVANIENSWVFGEALVLAAVAAYEQKEAYWHPLFPRTRATVMFYVNDDGSPVAVAKVMARGEKRPRWVDSDLNWYDSEPNIGRRPYQKGSGDDSES